MVDTKTRILGAALQLFNGEGEDNCAAVDIANALDISPGHLYYHFKGKDALIRALYDDFEREIGEVLAGPVNGFERLEDYLVFAHIVLEEFWDFRFFFSNLGSILRRYEDVRRRFVQLRREMRENATELLSAASDRGLLKLTPETCEAVSAHLVNAATFWIQSVEMDNVEGSGAEHIGEGVAQIATLLAPYLPGNRALRLA